ncbi:unnamed protein product [Closterium sp. Naga37s-1]|nr:unnamed protein product [Closterium sp. Naga37s-1]
MLVLRCSNLPSLVLHLSPFSPSILPIAPLTSFYLPAIRSLAFNELYGSIPSTLAKLTKLLYLDLSHNYLTGPAVTLHAACILDLYSSFLSGPLLDGACLDKNYSISQPVLLRASVLTKGTQRETRGTFITAPVTLFVYEAGQAALGCGLELAFHANFTFSLSPQSGRVGFNGFAFVVSATDRVGSSAGVGYGGMDLRSMAVEFDTLQNKEHGDMSSPHVGLNIRGEDKSVAAVKSPFPLSSRKAYTAWVDYEPGDPGTIQVFLADSQEKPQQAVLERRLALCEVLQGAAEQPAFFFGFVASTTVKPFQRHVILESTVDTGMLRR